MAHTPSIGRQALPSYSHFLTSAVRDTPFDKTRQPSWATDSGSQAALGRMHSDSSAINPMDYPSLDTFPTLNALWTASKDNTPPDASCARMLDNDCAEITILHPAPTRVSEPSSCTSHPFDAFKGDADESADMGEVYSDSWDDEHYDENEGVTPGLVSSSSEFDGSSDMEEDEDYESAGPATPVAPAYRQVHVTEQEFEPSDIIIIDPDSHSTSKQETPEPPSPVWSDYIESDLSCDSSCTCCKDDSPDVTHVHLPSPNRSTLSAEDRRRLAAPRLPVGGASKRLWASLMRERHQRGRDGLAMGGMKLPLHGRVDFAARLIPSNLLKLESDGSGWAGDLYEEVVHWIINVEPKSRYPHQYDLTQHLLSCRDTRFSAVHLFSRYLSRVGLFDLRPVPTRPESEDIQQSKRDIIWETAVACLTLAVKMHSDAWPPRRPVDSSSFQRMGPKYMSYQTLESCQRDVLSCLEYEISGVTPPIFLEDLIDTIPALAHAIHTNSRWRHVQDRVWDIILLAVTHWSSLLSFSVAALTAVALDRALYHLFQKDTAAETDPDLRDIRQELALPALKHIQDQVREVLGLSDREWAECSEWFHVTFYQTF